MAVGRNIIKLNEATIIEAVQFYFDNVMMRKDVIKVNGIRHDAQSGYFDVNTEAVEATK